jgi:hypothetical protein
MLIITLAPSSLSRPDEIRRLLIRNSDNAVAPMRLTVAIYKLTSKFKSCGHGANMRLLRRRSS